MARSRRSRGVYMPQKSIGSMTFSTRRQRRQQLEELEDDAEVAPAPERHLALAQRVHGGAADEHLAGGRPVDAR